MTANIKVAERKCYINGQFVGSGRQFAKINPVDGTVVAQVHEADRAMVDAAVRAARAALKGPWGKMALQARVDLLRKVRERIGTFGFQEARLREVDARIKRPKEFHVQASLHNLINHHFGRVEQKDVPVFGDWVANLDGYTNAQIQPQVTGYLIRQNYKEGSQVRKGQILYEIDPRPFQAAVDQANGQLAQAKAQSRETRSLNFAAAQIVRGSSNLEGVFVCTQGAHSSHENQPAHKTRTADPSHSRR